MSVRSAIVFIALTSSVVLASTPATIGVVTASGSFTVEGSRIWGNSTLFDGAKVETAQASSQLKLSNGATVQLAAGSSARVWKDRVVLERGIGQVTSTGAYWMDAGGIKVEGPRFRVNFTENPRLQVASFSGDARVTGPSGNLLASVPAGRNMSFALLQAVTRTGCLVYKTNGFILQVDDSPEVLQLNGQGLAANVGNRVQVTGNRSATAATITPATAILDVSAITQRSTGGCLSTAAALNAQTSVPSNAPVAAAAAGGAAAAGAATAGTVAAAGGLSTAATVGIVAAVAGGGAAAAIAVTGSKSSTSP
ncbi:MAG: hypothetical protein ABI811_05070 [Acidobacteriota bacterium]